MQCKTGRRAGRGEAPVQALRRRLALGLGFFLFVFVQLLVRLLAYRVVQVVSAILLFIRLLFGRFVNNLCNAGGPRSTTLFAIVPRLPAVVANDRDGWGRRG